MPERITIEKRLYGKSKFVPCRSSEVLPDVLNVGGYIHHAVISHKCGRMNNHEGACRCSCGVIWRKPIEVKKV